MIVLYITIKKVQYACVVRIDWINKDKILETYNAYRDGVAVFAPCNYTRIEVYISKL